MYRLILLLLPLINNSFCWSQSFTNVTNEQGIAFAFVPGDYGGGVSFVDFNKDGWDDITFAQNGSVPKFYQNNQTGFTLLPSFISNLGQMKAVLWVDYDNDFDLDLYVTRLWGTNSLYKNDGNMIFTDVTLASGLVTSDEYMSSGASWGDYDKDGDLDLYLCLYNGTAFGPLISNQLYQNNGNGTFNNVTVFAGVGNGTCYSMQSLWMDYNKDLWPDLLVVNDRLECSNYLYRNNQDGTFTDISAQSNIGGFNIFSMNNSADDYDNDGDLDVYITNNPTGNLLHRNEGNGTFTEVAEEAGVAVFDHTWAAHFLDYDNDGHLDLHVCSTPFWFNSGQNKFFKNNGDGTFTNYISQAGFLGDIGWSHCSAIGDFNNDGTSDIVISKQLPSASKLYKGPATENSWIKVKPEGTVSNIDGVGSWIECYANANTYVRYTYCGESYMCQNSQSEIFGLGEADLVDSVFVYWPSGVVDKWYSLQVNESYTLKEGNTIEAPVLTTQSPIYICEGDSIELSLNLYNSYLWSTGTNSSVLQITQPGEYWCAVVNEFGLTLTTDTIVVEFAPIPQVSEFFVNPSCFNSIDGSVGVVPIESIITEMNWVDTTATSLVLNSLPAGVYYYSAVNQHSCIVSDSISIYEPVALNVDLEIEHNLCFGDYLGYAQPTIAGGTFPYEVIWSAGSNEQLSSGIHSVLIEDINGCTQIIDFEILSPDPIIVDLQTTEASMAFGSGSAEIFVSGGVPPYNVLWNNGMDSQFIGELEPGMYTNTITDSNGCILITEFEIIYNEIAETENDEFLIYPNPTNSHVYIQNPDADIHEVIVVNSIGSIVKKIPVLSNSCAFQLDISELESGTYLIMKNNQQGLSKIGSVIKIPQ
ncbi:MAG: FG-GAP-like repeat-containing protein [Flavobacteriales bacterium]|nr:FG-GAP-like repeat-containing protein [Flavobacteriales bacterium]